jgi:hypothetical protein
LAWSTASNRLWIWSVNAARPASSKTVAISRSSRWQKPYWSLSIQASRRVVVCCGDACAAWRAVIQPLIRLWANMPKLPLESSTSSAFS